MWSPRAGAEGKAISLADEDGVFHIEAIHEYIKEKIPVEWAEDDLFVHDYKRTKPKHKPVEVKTHGKGHDRPHARPGEATGEAGPPKKRRRRPPRKKKTGGDQAGAEQQPS